MTPTSDIKTADQALDKMFYAARDWLYQRKDDLWYQVDMIPEIFRHQAIEILTLGKVGKRRVVENDTWTAFKLVKGKPSVESTDYKYNVLTKLYT